MTGRIKEEFKTGKGKYVAPAQIESRLAHNTDLEQLCLVGAGLNQPILIVTLSEQGRKRPRAELQAALERDLRALNAALEDHERIAQCLIVQDAWSPMNGLATPTGKLKRATLEAFYADTLRQIADRREPPVKWADAVAPLQTAS